MAGLSSLEAGGPPLPTANAAAYRPGMTLPPDQPPSPAKPKLSSEERQARHGDRLKTIRLRVLIGQELDHRGITTPAAIGEALGLPAAEAVKLLTGPSGGKGTWRCSRPRRHGWECRCRAPRAVQRPHRATRRLGLA